MKPTEMELFNFLRLTWNNYRISSYKTPGYYFLQDLQQQVIHYENYFLNLCEEGVFENSGMSLNYYYIIVKLIFTIFHNNYFPLCTKLGTRY